MKYGLIGYPLLSSFSPELHHILGCPEYTLLPIKENDLPSFFKKRDFLGINVTIPYKEKVIPFLDYVDEAAQTIGAVNTIVNNNGKLYGYNTDAYGFESLVQNFQLESKHVAILGSGGTSKTAEYVLKKKNSAYVDTVSRRPSKKQIDYDTFYKRTYDAVINTTPVGMYPDTDLTPIDVSKINCAQIIDVIYNPIRTRFQIEAQKNGVKLIAGGLKMLVYQAIASAKTFGYLSVKNQDYKELYDKILYDKQNIILYGMPSVGKTTVGKILSKITDKTFIDTDQLICETSNRNIALPYGYDEKTFRLEEKSVIQSLKAIQGHIISVGGGAMADNDNVVNLKYNGLLIYLYKSPENLLPDGSHPLSDTPQKMKKLFNERHPIYDIIADVKINCDGLSYDEVAKRIHDLIK